MVYAAMGSPSLSGQPQMPALFVAGLMLALLLMTWKLRRRHLVVMAMGLVLAATELGCGNMTNSGVTGTSTQVVQTITVSSGGAPTGLPASLGSITVQ